MELIEGVGESSTPLRSSFGGFGAYDVRIDVYNRLIESRNEESVCNPEFRDLLDAHFNRLPVRYGLDVNMDRVEDVLLHQKLLAQAKDQGGCPVFHVRFMENMLTKSDGNVDIQKSARVLSTSRECCIPEPEGVFHWDNRNKDSEIDFEPCSKLEDLNLDIKKNAEDIEGRYVMESLSERPEVSYSPIHEIVFSTTDKPKLLSQETIEPVFTKHQGLQLQLHMQQIMWRHV